MHVTLPILSCFSPKRGGDEALRALSLLKAVKVAPHDGDEACPNNVTEIANGSCRVPGWWLLGLGGVADGSLI